MNLTTTNIYPDFTSTLVEGLFLALSRKITEIQKSNATNPNTITVCTISADENEEYANVEFEGIEGNFDTEGRLVVNNPFNFPFATGTGTEWPFKATNLLQAAVDLGIFLANTETNSTNNPNSTFVMAYSISNTGEVVEPHFQISLSASDLPLKLTAAGDTLATQADKWLEGSV